MVRYSSVQAISDTSTKTVPYDAAKSTSSTKVVTEKIQNSFGSASGAGSGDFHVYRAARARENERIKSMEKSAEEEKLDQEFRDQRVMDEAECAAKTAKKRAKRQKQKEAKRRKKNLAKISSVVAADDDDDDDEEGDKYEKKLEGN